MLKLLKNTGIPIRVSLTLFLACGCQAHYDNEVRSSLTQVYGSDLSEYTFRGNPVGNFGVGTMYLKDLKDPSKSPDQAWLIGHPDSMFEETLTTQEKQQLLDMMIAQGSLGSARLNQDISTSLGLEATFPSLHGLLNASENINLSKGVTVVLGASEAINRKLNWTEFKEAVLAQKMKPGIAQHVNEGDFVIAAADLVLVGYKAKVSVDKNANGALDAKLNEVVGKVLGKDTSVQVSVRRTDSGAFEVESVNPVVAAVLFKDPPRSRGSRGTGLLAKNAPGMDEWRDLRLDSKRLEKVEQPLNH
jgi:hypothetical protein